MDGLTGQSALIIGATGFLGSHLATRLTDAGCKVHGISRDLSKGGSAVQWWAGDATNFEWLRGVMTQVKPGVVYNLASAGRGEQRVDLVLPTFENDLRTTVNTLVAAQEAGCGRVVITRSLDEPLTAGQAAASPYAAAKLASGIYGKLFSEMFGLPVVMLRPFMTYGPGQKSHKVLPYVIACMLKGESPVLGSGDRLVDWIYVDDVIAALVCAATAPDAAGAEIDLGSGTMISIRDAVDQIQMLIPGAPAALFRPQPDRSKEQIRTADLDRAKQLLGWAPKTSLLDGLTQTIGWYQARLSISQTAREAGYTCAS